MTLLAKTYKITSPLQLAKSGKKKKCKQRPAVSCHNKHKAPHSRPSWSYLAGQQRNEQIIQHHSLNKPLHGKALKQSHALDKLKPLHFITTMRVLFQPERKVLLPKLNTQTSNRHKLLQRASGYITTPWSCVM